MPKQLKAYDFRIMVRQADVSTHSGRAYYSVHYGGPSTVYHESAFNGTLAQAIAERARISASINKTHAATVSMKYRDDRSAPGLKDLETLYREEDASQPATENAQQATAPEPAAPAPHAGPYKFMHDPGHGWLAVPMAELRALDLANCISSYSYISRDGLTAYLEEDSDCVPFMLAKRWHTPADYKAHIVEEHHTDNRIRNLPRFPEAPNSDENRRAFIESRKELVPF
jgi:hypothetical protein